MKRVIDMSDQEVAERSAQAMWADDRASQRLGMTLSGVGPGRATVTMTITESMTNGHGMAHGGYIFTLADSAFAFACNAYNQRTVAQSCQIAFLQSVSLGDVLTAEAREVQRRGRSGIYDVRVSNGDGDVVAEFRGQSRTIKGTHLPDN